MRRLVVMLAGLALLAVGCPQDTDPVDTPAPTPAPTPTPGEDADVEAFVNDFMVARLQGDDERAESFLAPTAREQYEEGTGGLQLTGDWEAWEQISAEQADASSWEVQVRLMGAGTVEELLFVGPGTDIEGGQRPWVIRGAMIAEQ